jgi:cysteine desulfurase
MLVSAGEHPSVIAAAEAAAPGQVERIALNADCSLAMAALGRALGPDVGMVSVAAANHEIGTIQDLAQIAERVRGAGALFHSDLAQAAGWLAIDARNFDLASLSAHKMGGPIGVGALYIARSLRRRLVPSLHGGGQEAGARAGTLSPPLCAAFGEAARIADAEHHGYARAVAGLRDRLWSQLQGAGGVVMHGGRDNRLPGNLNVGFEGVDGEALVLGLRDTVAVSTGSACTAASLEPSHVLAAIGLDPLAASQAMRFGLGPRTTETEVDAAAEAVLANVTALRALRRRVA